MIRRNKPEEIYNLPLCVAEGMIDALAGYSVKSDKKGQTVESNFSELLKQWRTDKRNYGSQQKNISNLVDTLNFLHQIDMTPDENLITGMSANYQTLIPRLEKQINSINRQETKFPEYINELLDLGRQKVAEHYNLTNKLEQIKYKPN